MKLLKYVAILPVALLLCSVTFAGKNDTPYKVPFYGVKLNPASKIHVSYELSRHSTALYCTDNNSDAITSIEWSYKDATRKIDLPVMLSDTTKIGATSHYADPVGKLVITNEFGSSAPDGSILVTCYYSMN